MAGGEGKERGAGAAPSGDKGENTRAGEGSGEGVTGER